MSITLYNTMQHIFTLESIEKSFPAEHPSSLEDHKQLVLLVVSMKLLGPFFEVVMCLFLFLLKIT
jgi:hypothetical protein